MNLLKVFALALFFIVACDSKIAAQNSPEAKKTYEKILKLLEKGKNDNIPSLLVQAINQEKELGEEKDNQFIASIYYAYSEFFITNSDYYGYASKTYFYAAMYYLKANNITSAQTCFTRSYKYADSMSIYSSAVPYNNDSMSMAYVRYPVDSILYTRGDTTYFTVPLGTRDSISSTHSSIFQTIYDKSKPERKLLNYGVATFVDARFGASTWYVTPSKEGMESGFTPQKGDLLYTKMACTNNWHRGLIRELVQLNVNLSDDYKIPLFNYHVSQFITDEDDEELIISYMTRVIHKTAESLYDSINGTHLHKLDSGAFKNHNMWEAMLRTTNDDVKAFLRFVIDFPGKYMGRSYRIDETYATWLINFTPLANSEADSLLSEYNSLNSQAEFNDWVRLKGHYLEHAEFDFASISENIQDYITEEKFVLADSIIKQWYPTLKTFTTNERLFEFMYLDAYSNVAQKKYDPAIRIYKEVLAMDTNEVNAHFQLGHVYLEQDYFKAALERYQKVIDVYPNIPQGYGSYGWTLLKLGKNKPAQEYLKKAIDLDSTDVSYTMNYAHSLLLQNKSQEARKLYLKVLENLSTEYNYTEGLIADFDYFIDNGRMSDLMKAEKSFVESEWEKHYKFKVKGSDFFSKGQRLEDKKEYLKAAESFDQAIELEKQGRFVRYGLLRNYYRWSAYNYYKYKDYTSSLDRYYQAWYVNLSQLNDVDLEVLDLENISNLHDWLGNDAMEHMYGKMQRAAQRKVQNKVRSNNLYVVSIGANGQDHRGYQFAEKDASQIADILVNKGQRIFDNSSISVLNSPTKDSVTNVIENIISVSKPGDCFVFYYTGFTSQDQIVLGDDTISNEQILAWLSSISATKKLVLIDAANASLVSMYIRNQQSTSNDFSTESVSFLISDGRVEMPNAKTGLFTSYLLEGISGSAATSWKNSFVESRDSTSQIAYVTSKSLEGFMYGNMSTGNLDFDLKSYSSGVDFPITFVNSLSFTVDTIPPMIYIPNVVNTEGKRGGKTKIITISKNVGGQALDESGLQEVTVNGQPVAFSQNGKFNIDQNFTNVYTKLVIRAVDKKGNVALDSFQISKSDEKYVDPGQINDSQKNYALLFATSNYDEWSDLENPLKDVRKIEYQLKTYYNFEVDVKIDYTIDQMDSIIRVYKQQMQYSPNDQLLVYFAGHGHYEPGYGGYIVAKNSRKNGNLRTDYLKFDDIRTSFNLLYNCKHIMLVFDVCFGGAAFDKTNATNSSASDIEYMYQDPEGYLKKKLAIQSRLFMTSGGKEYVPDVSQFAQRFIETLESKGSKKNGFITFDDFTNNLQTIALLPDSKHPTTPRYGAFDDHYPGGDFILRYTKPKTQDSYEMKRRLSNAP